jgi:serine/threonine protein phosphatase PrpC
VGDRRNNQDRYICARSGDAVMLCLGDGMGGHPRGEDAARILIEKSSRLLDRAAKPIADPARFLERLMLESHLAIRRFGQRQSPPIDPRTTAVAALIQDDTAYWAHAGDSRLYVFRQGATISQTTDHSYVERLRRHGIITDRQKQTHPQRNFVTRCLGGSSDLPEVEQGQCRLQGGDILMLCSDGLWSSVGQTSMSETLRSELPLAQATRALTEEAANAAFPESDNVTVIALRVHSSSGRMGAKRTEEAPSARQPVDLQTAIAELQTAIESFEAEKQQEKS